MVVPPEGLHRKTRRLPTPADTRLESRGLPPRLALTHLPEFLVRLLVTQQLMVATFAAAIDEQGSPGRGEEKTRIAARIICVCFAVTFQSRTFMSHQVPPSLPLVYSLVPGITAAWIH